MPFKRVCVAALLSLPLTTVPVTALSSGDDPIVLSIGHERWTASQFQRLMLDTPPQVKEEAAAEPDVFAKRYADMHLLAQLAESRHLDQDADIRQRLAWVREGVMANAAKNDLYQRMQVGNEEVRRYYDAHVGDFVDYTLQHLVIGYHGAESARNVGRKDMAEDDARAEAEQLRKQLLEGKNFAELVQRYSDDDGSKSDGGLLPETASRNLLPEIAQGIADLKENEISHPIKTRYGYHLVRIIKRSDNSFEDARRHIVNLLKSQIVDQQIDAMRKAQPVVLNPAFFGH